MGLCFPPVTETIKTPPSNRNNKNKQLLTLDLFAANVVQLLNVMKYMNIYTCDEIIDCMREKSKT